MKTLRHAALAGAASLACVVSLADPAAASSANLSGWVKSTTTYYKTNRTVTANGSHIYLRINRVPADMVVFWYKCGDKSVRGRNVHFNPGDDGKRKLIGSDFRAGTVFCLGDAGDISESGAAWSGNLNWNVYA